VSAPAILIRLELEAAPRLLVDAVSEQEHDRLCDWLEAHPAYVDLVQQALALERQERAA
jgi:hypothetical protein